MIERGVLPAGMTANPRPDVGVGGELAFDLWHRLGGRLQLPEALYWFALYGVDDAELMLERLIAIRDAVQAHHRRRAARV